MKFIWWGKKEVIGNCKVLKKSSFSSRPSFPLLKIADRYFGFFVLHSSFLRLNIVIYILGVGVVIPCVLWSSNLHSLWYLHFLYFSQHHPNSKSYEVPLWLGLALYLDCQESAQLPHFVNHLFCVEV